MIIILDLDFTLLNSQGLLSEKTIDILKKCKQRGDIIVINSARSLIRTIEIAKKLDADYINCFHGNLVVDKNGKILHSNKFNLKDAGNLIADFQKIYKGWVGIETLDSAYCNDSNMAKKIGAIVAPEEEFASHDIYKFIFQLDKDKKEEYIKVASKYPCEINFNREGVFCTIVPKDSNKWNGLEILLKLLPKDKTIAFGDEITDLKTLQNVDIPVAMENSTEDLKREIKTCTLSNDEDGIAYFLEQLL